MYLVVDLARDEVVYNDAKLSAGQRLATALNDRLLTLLKSFARHVERVPEVEGLKLELTIYHRNFVTDVRTPGPTEEDRLELYAPADLIRKFAAQDITSQELVDGCIVIVNGNRVKVDLSQS